MFKFLGNTASPGIGVVCGGQVFEGVKVVTIIMEAALIEHYRNPVCA